MGCVFLANVSKEKTRLNIYFREIEEYISLLHHPNFDNFVFQTSGQQLDGFFFFSLSQPIKNVKFKTKKIFVSNQINYYSIFFSLCTNSKRNTKKTISFSLNNLK